MSLFDCPGCGRKISDLAKSCPQCGNQVVDTQFNTVPCEECGVAVLPGSVCGSCGYHSQRPESFVSTMGAGTGIMGVTTAVVNVVAQICWIFAALAAPGYLWWFIKGGFEDWGYLVGAPLCGCLSYLGYKTAEKIEERSGRST
jgi:hypothetical protein